MDWKKYVLINPIDVIFKDARDSENRPISNIEILNRSKEHILFKIKTTDPSSYVVRPNQGIIPADGSSINIMIQCLKDLKLVTWNRHWSSSVKVECGGNLEG